MGLPDNGNSTVRPRRVIPRRPTGFGSPFGATTTTTTTAGIGGFGSARFGTPVVSTTPTFGSTFGAPATSAAVFGSAFGGAGPSTAPTFGSSFNAPSTSIPSFGSTFGATATSAPTFGSTFGAPSTSGPNFFGASTSKPSLFSTPAGTSNFFSTPTTTPSLFGSGTTTTQAPSLFGSTPASNIFGATTTTPSLFGGSTSFGAGASTSGLFGATPAPTFGANTGLFPTTTTSAPSLFGGFSAPTQTPAYSSFGTGTGTFSNLAPATTTFGGFGFQAPKPVLATPPLPTLDAKLQQVMTSIFAINIYGDERDAVLKKWNMLQASWGTGKGYYSTTQPPVEYDHTNPYYRFKAIAYSVIPTPDNSDGLVKLHFNKKHTELTPQKEVLINGIAGILGGKPTLTVNIEHIKAISNNESEVMISVTERGVTGASRKIYASDLSMYLNQTIQKQQLTNVGVTFIGAYMAPTKAQLEEYLKIPPPGIDLPMWHAAQIDNPDPSRFIPTPMFGFDDLKKRTVCQEYETGLHRAFLEKTHNEIQELRRKQALTRALLTERKQKLLELQHRVLRILTKQESLRKAGMAMQPEEEAIRAKLATLHSQLGVSTQFGGRLREVISTVTLMDRLQAGPSTEQYRIEPGAQEDLRQYLQMEQTGIQHLVTTVNKDLKDLKVIQEGLNKTLNDNHK